MLRVTEKVGSATGQTIGYFYRDKFFAVNTRGLDNAYDTPDDIMYITLFDNFGRAVRNYATNATETQIYDTAYVDYTDFVSGSKANHKVTTDSVIGNTSFNYLSYGSFEQDTNWTPSYTGNGYSGATTDAKHLYGNKSLRLTSSGTSGSAKYTQSITIPAIGEYTFSIYVKAGNISSSGGGAYITLGGDSSEKLTGTTSLSVQDGWQRISVTKDFTSTGTYTAEVVLANATGTAYFDCGQVEFGSGASSVNLLQNGTKLENYWTGSEITSLSIGFANKITGSVNAQKSAYQTVNVNASIGQKFLLSGRAQASSAGLTDNRTFGLKAVLTYSNGTTEEHYVSFDQNITNWQYTSLVIIPKSTNTSLKVSTVTVYVVYDYNSGTMNFDDVFLAVSSAQTYSYDANTGNLKTASDAYGNQNSAEYTNNVDVKSITTVSGENYNYTYRTSNGVSTHQVSTATRNSRGVTQTLTYGYDNYGNTTSSTMTASGESAKISSSVGYTEYGNYISKTIDELGNATNYSYNSLTKLLEYVENANSKRTAYIYDTRQRISKVYLDSDEDGIADVSDPQVDYVYTNNRLTGISTAKTDYTLTYDVWGNVTKIMAGGNTLATYTYAANNGKLLKLTYGNGDYESYTYDHLDRLVTVEYNEYIMYDVGYDGNGQIAHVLDNDTFHFYTYDIYGRLVTARQYNDSISELKISVANGYDSLGRPSGTTYLVNGVERTYQITYCDSSNLVDKIALPANTTVDYEYDGFDRLIGSEVILSSSRSVAELYKYYTYTSNGSTYATNLVSELTLTYDYDTSTDAVNISTTYSYTYDNLGNILTVSKDGTLIESYEYDSLNQLVRENNLNGNFTVLYGYDSAGNLMYKNKLAYTTASTNSIINAVGTITSYTYSSSAWGDMLTNYGGTSIAYDEIGNPTNWRNASLLNWNGRTLKSITLTNGSILSFEYNTAGIRTQKMVGSSGTTITYDYILDGTNIVAQIGSDGTRIEYLYDEKGSVIGCIYGGLGYYYRKNLQGDIVSIASHTGEIVVEYTYDAWGNILSITGSKSSGLGQINSFRYRGYFYDTETGLYYLNSRYYDPTVGRFISPDDSAVLTATPTALTDKNLYAYCDNNPVVRTDNGGQFWDTLFDVVSLVASVADVISDPTNVGAWVGLACDVVDVAIPFVGGFGEAYRIVNASIGVADTLDDVHDAKKATQRALESIENASKTLNRGSNTVYISYKGDTLEYVGITNDFGRRKTEWAGIRNIVEFVPGLDRKSARFVEQIVIDTFGMAKNGGDLSNKINSISIRNSIYEEYLEFAGRIK